MNIRIKDRINEIREKEKTWNLTRDEVIIKEMYNCLVAISESLVTYTKEYNADSFENSIRKQLEKTLDKDIVATTIEDIMDEVTDMPARNSYEQKFNELTNIFGDMTHLSKEGQVTYENILDDWFDKGTAIDINELLGDKNAN